MLVQDEFSWRTRPAAHRLTGLIDLIDVTGFLDDCGTGVRADKD